MRRSGQNEEVLALVRRELREREMPVGVLFQLAQRIAPELAELGQQHFNVRYYVPVLQELKPVKRVRRKRRGSKDRRSSEPAARRRGHASSSGPAEPARGSDEQADERVPGTRAAVAPTTQPEPPPKPRSRPASGPAAPADRERIRALFHTLADDLAAAETAVEIVAAVSRIEDLVDEALEGAR